MERTDTQIYVISRLLIRALGPMTPKDKNAKEILLTTLWSNFWDDDGDFPSQLQFTRDEFGSCDFLTQHWANIRLVEWTGKHSKILKLGEMGRMILDCAIQEIKMREGILKIDDVMDKYKDLMLEQQDLKALILSIGVQVETVKGQVREIRKSQIRGI